MFLLENLPGIVLWLLATIAAVNLAFLYFVFYRRFSRTRFYAAKDAARQSYSPAVNSFLNQTLSLVDATAVLLAAQSYAEREAIEELLLSRITAENASRVTELLFAMGFVQRWAQQVFGKRRVAVVLESTLRRQKCPPATRRLSRVTAAVRRLRLYSVPRALALARLGKLDPVFVHAILAEAMLDPAIEVRRVAVCSMGRLAYDGALPLLMEELRRAIAGHNDVSLRTTKGALARYSLSQVSRFAFYLNDAHPRFRYFILNAAAAICGRAAATMVLNKNDFSPEFCGAALKLTSDANPDVRAQSAEVVQHFGDAASSNAIRRLLFDEDEYVRLHAVRAADRHIELMPELVRCLSDACWRVREAAVKALTSFGTTGANEVYRHFAATSDGYSSEQIADEIQRGGIVRDLIGGLASTGEYNVLAMAACRKMVTMGKTSLLMTALATSPSPAVRVALMYALIESPSEEVLALLQVLGESDTGVVRETARTLLRRYPGGAAYATGGTA